MPRSTKRAELLEQILNELESRERDAEERTVGNLWDEWAPTMAQTTQARTIASARARLDMSVPAPSGAFVLSQLRVVDMTAARLSLWLEALARAPKLRGRGTLAPGTQYQVRVALQGCLAWHMKRGSIRHNPLSEIPWTTRPGRRVGYFSSLEECEAFIACFPPVVADMLRVGRQCGGLRLSEMLGLRKSKVDHADRTITVRRKGGKDWTVVLTDEAYEIIVERSRVAPGDIIFPDPRDPEGGAIKPGTYQSYLTRARRRYGKTVYGGHEPTTHILRHDWFKSLLDSDNPPPLNYLAEQGGLVSVSQITNTYGRMRGPEARESFRLKLNRVNKRK